LEWDSQIFLSIETRKIQSGQTTKIIGTARTVINQGVKSFLGYIIKSGFQIISFRNTYLDFKV